MHGHLGADVKSYIENKAAEHPAGEIICTEVELAGYFQVSRPTIRKRIDQLIEENFIVRVSGKGIALAPTSVNILVSSGKKYIIMVSSFAYDDGFFSEISKGLFDVFNEQGDEYRIITNVDFRERLDILMKMDLKFIDGIIMTAYECEESYRMVDLLEKNHVPIILVDNQLENRRCNCVKNDDFGGGKMLGRYLAGKGVGRIAFVLPDKLENATAPLFGKLQFDNSHRERLDGLRSGLLESGIDMGYENCISLVDFHTMMTTQPQYDAFVFCDSEVMASNISRVHVPRGIEICTFGDTFLKLVRRSCAHTKFNGYAIGCSAARRIGQIKSGSMVVEYIATEFES